MPPHRQRYRCASRRADRPSGQRAGTACSRHGDPVGSPVRYASRAGNRTPRGRPAPARLHRGRADARHARYASAGAAWGELPPGLPARLAGGRGDAVASPTLPLRIAPCRSLQRTARRHCSLASRRPRRVASSLRLARRQSDPSWQTRTGSLASRPRRRASRSLRLGRCGLGRTSTRPPGTARWRAWRCRRIANATAAPRAVPIAPADAAPALLARVTATPSGRQFATPRAPAIRPLTADPHRLARIAAAPSRVTLATPRPARVGASSRPASRHGSLAGVPMPSQGQRCRCASRRADRPSGRRAGTARSRHGDPVGSPVRYASRAATSATRCTTLLRHRDDRSRSFGPTTPATSGRP